MNHQVKKLRERVGLLRPAFRVHEALQAIRFTGRRSLYQDNLGPDGLPIPPSKLIVLLGGHNNVSAFLDGSRMVAQRIQDLLQRHLVHLPSFRREGSGRAGESGTFPITLDAAKGTDPDEIVENLEEKVGGLTWIRTRTGKKSRRNKG